MAAAKKPATAPAEPSALTLEGILTGSKGFGLTAATAVQRAVCRVIDGLQLGDLADHPRVIRALGGKEATAVPAALLAPAGRPRKVFYIAGIRGAKTESIAAHAVRSALSVDVSRLSPGDVPRYSILSTSLDIAKVAFNDHLVGKIMASPVLRGLMLDEPTSDALLLRHPSGRPVEIKIVAGARAGATLVARWSAGMAADEAPRMHGDEAVVNFGDSMRAVEGRLLPGAQILAFGSPWAPEGPVYDTTITRWGTPGPDLVVIRAPAYDLNPVHWTPEACAQLLKESPDTYRTDVDAEFADPETALLSSVEVERAIRPGEVTLPARRGRQYAAAMDPATRGNAWTIAVAHIEGGKLVIDLARQWQGSKADPLSPRTVLGEMAALLRPYGVEFLLTDQWGFDFAREPASDVGLVLVEKTWTAASKLLAFDALRLRLSTDAIELPPDPTLRADLLSVRRRVTTNGVAIHLPTTGDGRHADYASALAMLAAEYIAEMSLPPPPPDDEAALEAAVIAQEQREAETPWWES